LSWRCAQPSVTTLFPYPTPFRSFRAKGRTETERERVLAEASAVEAAGAFATVVEGVDAQIASEVTRALKIPTIGIGASADCDGQDRKSTRLNSSHVKNSYAVFCL